MKRPSELDPLSLGPPREGTWLSDLLECLAKCTIRHGTKGKRGVGPHGQASWFSSVVNLVNTSELQSAGYVGGQL